MVKVIGKNEVADAILDDHETMLGETIFFTFVVDDGKVFYKYFKEIGISSQKASSMRPHCCVVRK